MMKRTGATAGSIAILLACPAVAAGGHAKPARLETDAMALVDYQLSPAAARRVEARWLLPDIAASYDAPPAKPRVRIRGRKVKVRLPI